ncbi:hypothetical protein K469DRAFT_801095 [Zopfia rhizophila CBS 207.26]|uniref:Uncharacterized protein n=1 Tax=Zopfia rhizophila CBS 207.26 TaxID=1314779 RepID=A0A6A6EKS3_9PEZI|nr:hypothetical protein K469DRAFT_801095 [Zopfia rhizophila CBS 207.26]
MPLLDIFRAVRDHTRGQHQSLRTNNSKLRWRISDVFARAWDLDFTTFGGRPVHFGILYRWFVEGAGGKTKWIDGYQERFAICQALPSPASTKMVFCIALIHAGLLSAIFAFLVWSLPGAIGMYGLSLGVQNMPAALPPIVYALLSGMNTSTVGIITLATMQQQPQSASKSVQRRNAAAASRDRISIEQVDTTTAQGSSAPKQRDGERHLLPAPVVDTTTHSIPVKVGPLIIVVFFGTISSNFSIHLQMADRYPTSLTSVTVARGAIKYRPSRSTSSQICISPAPSFLAEAPVVIPLLHEYVVEPGWVPRRLPNWSRHHLGFSWPKFQFQRLSGCASPRANIHPNYLRDPAWFYRHFCSGTDVSDGRSSSFACYEDETVCC